MQPGAGNGGVPLRLAFGSPTSLGRCQDRVLTWDEFCRMLAMPHVGSETLEEFLALSVNEQNRLKNSNGWFVGGSVPTGRRSAATVINRTVITLDVDAGSPMLVTGLRNGLLPICRYEFFIRTTRKHNPIAPRYQIYILLTHPVETEKYEALSRILGYWFDPSMDSLDPAGFRHAQLMYMPTASRNAEFLAWRNEGRAVDPDALLASWPADWRDYAALPYSDRHAQARLRPRRAEDPRNKRGIIGAFCRAFDIESAVDHFLPGVYVPGTGSDGPGRYTYAAGSGANGAIVYDNGLFLFSHHTTDPVCDRSVNAFDLVRMHRFGGMDVNVDENTTPAKMPSYAAMVNLIQNDPATKAAVASVQVDFSTMFDELPPGPVAPVAPAPLPVVIAQPQRIPTRVDLHDLFGIRTYPKPWLDTYKPISSPVPIRELPGHLELDGNGAILSTLPNLWRIVLNDPRLYGRIAYNGFARRIVAMTDLTMNLPGVNAIKVKDTRAGDEWTDDMDVIVRAMLEEPRGPGRAGWGLQVKDRDLKAAIGMAANQNRFHPFLDYLNRLTWDGTPRVESFWCRHLGMPDSAYARETALLFFVAVVARTHFPGHKWDHVPVMTGEQGQGKSTLLRMLFGELAGDLTAEMFSKKETVEQMLGKMCLELPETTHLRKSEIDKVKAFITFSEDRVRLSYDKRISTFPRQCVFVGTGNLDEFLKDPTGNRRFWPLHVHVRYIDLPAVKAERDQLWAEAYVIWKRMCDERQTAMDLPLYLGREANALAEQLQDLAKEEDREDNLTARIADWLETPVPMSVLAGQPTFPVDGQTEEPKVLRTRTCARQVCVELLGMTISDIERSGRPLDATVGSAIRRVPGWGKSVSRHHFIGYGRCRTYSRLDVSPQQILDGYALTSL